MVSRSAKPKFPASAGRQKSPAKYRLWPDLAADLEADLPFQATARRMVLKMLNSVNKEEADQRGTVWVHASSGISILCGKKISFYGLRRY